jgi:hypothetical protein
MNYKRLDVKLQKMQDIIGRDRDKLDEIIGEYESLKDDCSEAWEDLDRARDALSRLV